MRRFDNHTHTHKSNIINRDSTNFEDKLIDRAIELNLAGISITDHGNLSAHVKALQHLEKLREKVNKEPQDDFIHFHDLESLNKKIYKDRVNNFKLGLGTEIYLVDRQEVKELRSRNEYIRFYHLVLVAKNYEGYRALAELSSKSWEDSFYYRGMERIPTYKDYFCEWAERNKGNIIVSSACLGSELAKLIRDYIEEESMENWIKITTFLYTMWKLFGDDFYIEIQPSHSEEQIKYNKIASYLSESSGMKCIITTDAHYLSKDKQEFHSRFLKSQDAERETESFYASTYLMGVDELKEYFLYLPQELFEKYLSNSLEIADKIQEFSLYRDIEVPNTKIQLIQAFEGVLTPFLNPLEHEFTLKFKNSSSEVDRILFQQIELGVVENKLEINPALLNRIEKELKILWLVSKKIKQRLSNYYLLTKEIVSIIWKVSLVGISRGSAGSFLLCYILGITGINPMEFNLDEWRHLSIERPELPDVDIDSEAGQRAKILELIKDYYGHDKVLNIATFKTEGASSAIQTMCRGMDISTEMASYLSSLVPKDMSIKKCLENYDTDKQCATLIKELMSYEGLLEGVLEIEDLCCGRSVHASGIYIYNDSYWKTNAMMKAPKGQPITQYDMFDSDYQGGLKVDMLTIEALDRVRKSLELLLEDNIIEWKGDLKSTYNEYIHPTKIDLKKALLWKDLRSNSVLNAFQFDSVQGKSALAKVAPNNFKEVMDCNALMRLSVSEGEQPIDRYIKHKANIEFWYQEMRLAGLNNKEIKVMEKHLLSSYGCAITQESVMRISLDPDVANFDLKLANKLRKAIAKAKAKHLIAEVKELFFELGLKNGNRFELLDYVWRSCIEPMLGYAFSEPHIAGYTLILTQEIWLNSVLSELHWKVACLAVDAGDINSDVTKATDYGALAKAIGDMEKGFVTPPYINIAKVGFSPNSELGTCTYGLGALNGISMELAREIINLRPFSSFKDFYDRCVLTKIVQPSKVYSLIKGGCFDLHNPNRAEVMCEFISLEVPDKQKLTTANISKLIQFGAIPSELQMYVMLYHFRKATFAKHNIVEMYNKTQGLYVIPDQLLKFFGQIEHSFMEAIEYDCDGNMCLKSKEFDKTYKELIKPLSDWLASKEAVDLFNLQNKMEVWNKYCIGSLEKWEMDSLSYYTDKHELQPLELEKYYEISNFKALPEEPEKYEYQNPKTGRVYLRNKLYLIAGVVVDKNKNKNMITLNTEYGVVDVKLDKDSYTKYGRKLEYEKSWFDRGTKLMLLGYRRGESFYPKNYFDSKFVSKIMKLEVDKNNKPYFIRERDI